MNANGVKWYLDKDELTENIYVYVNRIRARSRKNQEMLDAVEQVDYGNNDDEIKVSMF